MANTISNGLVGGINVALNNGDEEALENVCDALSNRFGNDNRSNKEVKIDESHYQKKTKLSHKYF